MASQNSTTIVCQNPHFYVDKKDFWNTGNPIYSPTSLFFLQTSLVAFVTQCINLLLRPLGQSTIVSQILGGLIFGPSVLGHNNLLPNVLFPANSTIIIDTSGAFGVMFFFFLVGVKMDPVMLLKTERKAIAVGISVFFFTLGLPVIFSIILRNFVAMDISLARCLPFIAASQCLTAFPVICCLLTELKILNSDIGRLALSASMVTDCIGLVFTVVVFAIMENITGNFLTLLWILLCAAAFFWAIVYIIRPTIIWMLSRSKTGNQVNEMFIMSVITFVLITGLISEVLGQHYIIGPLILGLAVPDGPPIGSTLISRLETIIVVLFYPVFLAASGLQTNLCKITFQSLWIVGLVVVFSCIVKIGAVMLPGFFSDIPMRECYVIGLILNARGVAELVIYNFWKRGELFSDQEFALVVISVIIVTAVITPMIRHLYDPSDQYFALKGSSIQHSKRESDLRVMVCFHNNENVHTIISLLEASCATIESPIQVIALTLVELEGRARPLLMAHQTHETLNSSSSSNSNHIDNALKQFELHNEGRAAVQSFTSISNFDTVDDDICRIAFDRRATILIMPFHKQWEIDGGVEIINRAARGINLRVLDKAPCSVAILIDRGILSGSPSLLTSKSAYQVVVFFVCGADDAEALAYGSRMARHEKVVTTVVRFLPFGEENSKERKRESDVVDEYRNVNAGNERFEIIEEVVRDGEEMSSTMKKMIEYFDLVIVGREHKECTLLKGLEEWSEHPELGVMGDMLSAQDVITKASVLVVQQQRITGKMKKTKTKKVAPNSKVCDVDDDDYSPRVRQSTDSMTISVGI